MAGPIEGFNPTPFGRLLYARQEFENYAQKFTAEGDTRIAQQATGRRTVDARTSSSTMRWWPTSASS